jgi:hypothetical protein
MERTNKELLCQIMFSPRVGCFERAQFFVSLFCEVHNSRVRYNIPSACRHTNYDSQVSHCSMLHYI